MRRLRRVRRTAITGPVVAAAGAVELAGLDQIVQEINAEPGSVFEKLLGLFDGHFGRGAGQVVRQDDRIVGVDARVLGAARQQPLRVRQDVLIHRPGARYQHADRGPLAPSCPAHLLACAGDRARIACQHRGVQPADVDAQLQRTGRHHAPHRALAQPFFDLAALAGQIAAAVAADG